MTDHEPRHLALAQEWLGCEEDESACWVHAQVAPYDEEWPCSHVVDLADRLARFEAAVRADECGVLSGAIMLGLQGDEDTIDSAVEIVEDREAEHRARAGS